MFYFLRGVGSINSHCFPVVGDGKLNPIVGVSLHTYYEDFLITGGMTIPNIRSLYPGSIWALGMHGWLGKLQTRGFRTGFRCDHGKPLCCLSNMISLFDTTGHLFGKQILANCRICSLSTLLGFNIAL